MGRLAQTDGLTDIQRDILSTVRDFTEKEIIPVASDLEHKDEYPTQIVEGMTEFGLFGLSTARWACLAGRVAGILLSRDRRDPMRAVLRSHVVW